MEVKFISKTGHGFYIFHCHLFFLIHITTMNHHFSPLVFLMKLSRIRCVFINLYFLFHIFQLICQILTLSFTLIFLQFAVFKVYLISLWKKDGEEKKGIK